MDIVSRARAFVQRLQSIARRRPGQRQCPHCGSRDIYAHGSYTRHPWTLKGRRTVEVACYCCQTCGKTYSLPDADLIRGSWYARSVHRCAMDQWLHMGASLRRVTEWLRSQMGRQERWQIWHPLSCPPAEADRCRLNASTLQRWLDAAGARAEGYIEEQYAGIPASGQMGTDGLWARLRGGVVRVMLMLRDSVTGVLWPPVVAEGDGRSSLSRPDGQVWPGRI